MKKLFAMLCVIAVCFAAVIPTAAADQPRLVDNANLLTVSEEADITAKLDEISARQQFDVVIVTVDSTEGKTPMDYADDYYDSNGYGFGDNYDGILLLISMEERDWWISTCGYGITAFTDAGIEYIGEEIVFDLSGESYADAFMLFAELCDDFVTQARTGDPYDYHNLPEEPFDPVFTLILALIVGFVIAIIATLIMKAQLKSVRHRSAASDYTKKNSLSITESRDLFLYRTVHRREKPKESSGGSSTHRSSSGRSHGGGGGKF